MEESLVEILGLLFSSSPYSLGLSITPPETLAISDMPTSFLST
jgi:hypothetical protein